MIRIKDPVNGGLHLFAALLSAVGFFLLIRHATRIDSARHLVAYTVFASSMFLLYCASAAHHLVPKSLRYAKLFRKLDHSRIFVLIAGTYTPVCLIALKGGVSSLLLVANWLIAFAGITIKVADIKISRHVSTALYVGMGGVAVIALHPIIRELSIAGFTWLLAGGIAYSIGALIYAYRIPDPVPKVFGFHEIFHLFVMAGIRT